MATGRIYSKTEDPKTRSLPDALVIVDLEARITEDFEQRVYSSPQLYGVFRSDVNIILICDCTRKTSNQAIDDALERRRRKRDAIRQAGDAKKSFDSIHGQDA